MRQRLTALDGIRGFAALSVLLFHINTNNRLLEHLHLPVLKILYSFFSSGANGVQMLFVLSGFLIATRYPLVPDPISFIQRRYTRIFPVLLVIVVFFWFSQAQNGTTKIYYQLPLLFLFAILGSLVWRLIKKIHNTSLNRCLFIGFLLFQLGVLFLAILLKATNEPFSITHPYTNFLTLLTNLTLIFPFVRNTNLLDGVIWSLAPELLFYILYPFIVVPLMQYGKKQGYGTNILLVLGLCVGLIWLEISSHSFTAISTIKIGRSTGFIAGIIAACIYQSQGTIWKRLSVLSSSRLFGVFILCGLCLTQYFAIILGSSNIILIDSFWLVSGWFISLFMLYVIASQSLLSTIFRHRVLTFLGMVSYSQYLIHLIVIGWLYTIMDHLEQYGFPRQPVYVFTFIATVVITIAISYMLYALIEALYFKKNERAVKEYSINKNHLQRAYLALRSFLF